MSIKTVSLKESAYEKLRTLKREGESFSDVVERISQNQSLKDLEGVYPEIGEIKEQIEKEREQFQTRDLE